jgi:transcriptional regulator with XRE-family HTH domain
MMAMNKLGDRIKELLKDKQMTLVDLCEKTKVSKAQMNRYVNHGTQPQGDILNKISTALGTSVDFLLNGKTDEKAKAMIKNNELLNQFKAVESMTDKDRNIISELISAFIAKRQLQQIIK